MRYILSVIGIVLAFGISVNSLHYRRTLRLSRGNTIEEDATYALTQKEGYPYALIHKAEHILGRPMSVDSYGTVNVGVYIVDPGEDFIGTRWYETQYFMHNGLMFTHLFGIRGLLSIRISELNNTLGLLIRHVHYGIFSVSMEQHIHAIRNMEELGQALANDHKQCVSFIERRTWRINRLVLIFIVLIVCVSVLFPILIGVMR